MIVRILGEGQYNVGEEHVDALNRLDAGLQNAAEAGDDQAFRAALRTLLEAVRRLGTPLPTEALVPSDLVLPEGDTSLAQVNALLTDEGLIPG